MRFGRWNQTQSGAAQHASAVVNRQRGQYVVGVAARYDNERLICLGNRLEAGYPILDRDLDGVDDQYARVLEQGLALPGVIDEIRGRQGGWPKRHGFQKTTRVEGIPLGHEDGRGGIESDGAAQ